MKATVHISRTVQLYQYEPLVCAMDIETDVSKENFDAAIDAITKKLIKKIDNIVDEQLDKHSKAGEYHADTD